MYLFSGELLKRANVVDRRAEEASGDRVSRAERRERHTLDTRLRLENPEIYRAFMKGLYGLAARAFPADQKQALDDYLSQYTPPRCSCTECGCRGSRDDRVGCRPWAQCVNEVWPLVLAVAPPNVHVTVTVAAPRSQISPIRSHDHPTLPSIPA